MAKSGMGDVLTLGLIGAAVWFGWPYISQMLASIGAAPSAPSNPPPVPGPTSQLQLTQTQVTPPPTPAPPVNACANVPTGTYNTLLASALQGFWTNDATTLATDLNVPVDCQLQLQALAQTIGRNKGIAGLGRGYVRRGTPMRFR